MQADVKLRGGTWRGSHQGSSFGLVLRNGASVGDRPRACADRCGDRALGSPRSRPGAAARELVSQLLAGHISSAFYGGIVLVGILVSVGLALTRNRLDLPELVRVGAIGLASLVGAFYGRYCVVKTGVYVPLVGLRASPTARASAM